MGVGVGVLVGVGVDDEPVTVTVELDDADQLPHDRCACTHTLYVCPPTNVKLYVNVDPAILFTHKSPLAVPLQSARLVKLLGSRSMRKA